MQDLNDMYLFAKVVEHGGYTAASQALGIPVSRISRRIAMLEEGLGVRLLNRTTRKISVTEIGQTYYQHCAALVAEAAAAREAVDRTTSQPQGLIRFSCPVGLLHSDIAAIVADYLDQYPLVRVQIDATSHRVDVVEEGFDLALRVRQPPFEDSELVVRPLATARMVLVATPDFFRKYGEPQDVGDLARLPTLSMVQAAEKHIWRFAGPDGREVSVGHVPRLSVDDLTTLRAATLQGLGLACLPWYLVAADVEGGQLRVTLPQYSPPEGIVQAVFPSRRGLVPAVRQFLDALVAAYHKQAPAPG
ncbi:MAG: LysR substrate-binding domain-containing protein [Pigmentiphaga sp.]|uniref:LysR substrate-binding domain-containing protein n=1 Tax=Pigmentiphaga sp. TaxID=1977564 RepID=UPI0029B41F99|nr:LysR substrate-binding domain-containing protein [Pigmentiphaga sp.]MDX3905372.1 LysR substrate-binding domain-containing protein [Pigmentiphaga sp.]